jgi:hypothetical protein
MIAKIDKHQAAMVALAMDPAGQTNRAGRISQTKGAAGV